MELVYLGIFVLVLYLAVRLAAKTLSRFGGGRHRPYRQLAALYGGRFESRGMVDPPTVSFPHGGSSVRVGLAPTVAGQPSPPRSRVVARFGRGLPFRFELMPAGRPSPAQPPKGTRPVRVGIPDFDRAYSVQANDPEIARELLADPEVRRAVEGLRALSPPSGILISVNPERMLIQVDRNLGNRPGLLETAVLDALTIHDRLLLEVSRRLGEGVDIIEVANDPAAEAKCEVCGDPIEGAHVNCATCRTPFHGDCWAFVGGCSTYGCPSKHAVPA